MRYDQTSTYAAYEGTLRAEMTEIERKIEALHGITKVASKRSSLKSQLKTRASKLEKMQDLSAFSLYELTCMLNEVEGTKWTLDEGALWNSERSVHEGRGEKGLKLRFGLSMEASLESGDLGSLGEVKNMQAAAGESIQCIQLGKCGKQQYGMLLMSASEAGLFKTLDDDLRAAIAYGEVTGGMMYHTLPDFLQELYQTVLSPTNVLQTYAAIWGATQHGFVRVPRHDYDVAWRLVNVTKMSPRYMLRREYVEKRLTASLNPEAATVPATAAPLPSSEEQASSSST